jgi:hypothetical protein
VKTDSDAIARAMCHRLSCRLCQDVVISTGTPPLIIVTLTPAETSFGVETAVKTEEYTDRHIPKTGML